MLLAWSKSLRWNCRCRVGEAGCGGGVGFSDTCLPYFITMIASFPCFPCFNGLLLTVNTLPLIYKISSSALAKQGKRVLFVAHTVGLPQLPLYALDPVHVSFSKSQCPPNSWRWRERAMYVTPKPQCSITTQRASPSLRYSSVERRETTEPTVTESGQQSLVATLCLTSIHTESGQQSLVATLGLTSI